ncbi:MAG: IS66 family insertion sequence element accessory protein TnpA [Acidiferrobacter sp.]
MDKKRAAVMRSGAQWDQILVDYQESGQSIRTFCKAREIGLSSFYTLLDVYFKGK